MGAKLKHDRMADPYRNGNILPTGTASVSKLKMLNDVQWFHFSNFDQPESTNFDSVRNHQLCFEENLTKQPESDLMAVYGHAEKCSDPKLLDTTEKSKVFAYINIDRENQAIISDMDHLDQETDKELAPGHASNDSSKNLDPYDLFIENLFDYEAGNRKIAQLTPSLTGSKNEPSSPFDQPHPCANYDNNDNHGYLNHLYNQRTLLSNKISSEMHTLPSEISREVRNNAESANMRNNHEIRELESEIENNQDHIGTIGPYHPLHEPIQPNDIPETANHFTDSCLNKICDVLELPANLKITTLEELLSALRAQSDPKKPPPASKSTFSVDGQIDPNRGTENTSPDIVSQKSQDNSIKSRKTKDFSIEDLNKRLKNIEGKRKVPNTQHDRLERVPPDDRVTRESIRAYKPVKNHTSSARTLNIKSSNGSECKNAEKSNISSLLFKYTQDGTQNFVCEANKSDIPSVLSENLRNEYFDQKETRRGHKQVKDGKSGRDPLRLSLEMTDAEDDSIFGGKQNNGKGLRLLNETPVSSPDVCKLDTGEGPGAVNSYHSHGRQYHTKSAVAADREAIHTELECGKADKTVKERSKSVKSPVKRHTLKSVRDESKYMLAHVDASSDIVSTPYQISTAVEKIWEKEKVESKSTPLYPTKTTSQYSKNVGSETLEKSSIESSKKRETKDNGNYDRSMTKTQTDTLDSSGDVLSLFCNRGTATFERETKDISVRNAVNLLNSKKSKNSRSMEDSVTPTDPPAHLNDSFEKKAAKHKSFLKELSGSHEIAPSIDTLNRPTRSLKPSRSSEQHDRVSKKNFQQGRTLRVDFDHKPLEKCGERFVLVSKEAIRNFEVRFMRKFENSDRNTFEDKLEYTYRFFSEICPFFHKMILKFALIMYMNGRITVEKSIPTDIPAKKQDHGKIGDSKNARDLPPKLSQTARTPKSDESLGKTQDITGLFASFVQHHKIEVVSEDLTTVANKGISQSTNTSTPAKRKRVGVSELKDKELVDRDYTEIIYEKNAIATIPEVFYECFDSNEVYLYKHVLYSIDSAKKLRISKFSSQNLKIFAKTPYRKADLTIDSPFFYFCLKKLGQFHKQVRFPEIIRDPLDEIWRVVRWIDYYYNKEYLDTYEDEYSTKSGIFKRYRSDSYTTDLSNMERVSYVQENAKSRTKRIKPPVKSSENISDFFRLKKQRTRDGYIYIRNKKYRSGTDVYRYYVLAKKYIKPAQQNISFSDPLQKDELKKRLRILKQTVKKTHRMYIKYALERKIDLQKYKDLGIITSKPDSQDIRCLSNPTDSAVKNTNLLTIENTVNDLYTAIDYRPHDLYTSSTKRQRINYKSSILDSSGLELCDFIPARRSNLRIFSVEKSHPKATADQESRNRCKDPHHTFKDMILKGNSQRSLQTASERNAVKSARVQEPLSGNDDRPYIFARDAYFESVSKYIYGFNGLSRTYKSFPPKQGPIFIRIASNSKLDALHERSVESRYENNIETRSGQKKFTKNVLVTANYPQKTWHKRLSLDTTDCLSTSCPVTGLGRPSKPYWSRRGLFSQPTELLKGLGGISGRELPVVPDLDRIHNVTSSEKTELHPALSNCRKRQIWSYSNFQNTLSTRDSLCGIKMTDYQNPSYEFPKDVLFKHMNHTDCSIEPSELIRGLDLTCKGKFRDFLDHFGTVHNRFLRNDSGKSSPIQQSRPKNNSRDVHLFNTILYQNCPNMESCSFIQSLYSMCSHYNTPSIYRPKMDLKGGELYSYTNNDAFRVVRNLDIRSSKWDSKEYHVSESSTEFWRDFVSSGYPRSCTRFYNSLQIKLRRSASIPQSLNSLRDCSYTWSIPTKEHPMALYGHNIRSKHLYVKSTSIPQSLNSLRDCSYTWSISTKEHPRALYGHNIRSKHSYIDLDFAYHKFPTLDEFYRFSHSSKLGSLRSFSVTCSPIDAASDRSFLPNHSFAENSSTNRSDCLFDSFLHSSGDIRSSRASRFKLQKTPLPQMQKEASLKTGQSLQNSTDVRISPRIHVTTPETAQNPSSLKIFESYEAGQPELRGRYIFTIVHRVASADQLTFYNPRIFSHFIIHGAKFLAKNNQLNFPIKDSCLYIDRICTNQQNTRIHGLDSNSCLSNFSNLLKIPYASFFLKNRRCGVSNINQKETLTYLLERMYDPSHRSLYSYHHRTAGDLELHLYRIMSQNHNCEKTLSCESQNHAPSALEAEIDYEDRFVSESPSGFQVSQVCLAYLNKSSEKSTRAAQLKFSPELSRTHDRDSKTRREQNCHSDDMSIPESRKTGLTKDIKSIQGSDSLFLPRTRSESRDTVRSNDTKSIHNQDSLISSRITSESRYTKCINDTKSIQNQDSDPDSLASAEIGEKAEPPVQIVLKHSKVHGVGCFTDRKVLKGSFIGWYHGLVSQIYLDDALENLYTSQNIKDIYLFDSGDAIIDATCYGSRFKFANHGCSPNIKASRHFEGCFTSIQFHAIKDIEAGDELLLDYQFAEGEEIPCLCKQAECKGHIGQK